MGLIVPADTIIKQLAEFCTKYPTRSKAAKALKVTPAQLSQTLNKKNNVIPERILKRLGYRSETVYKTVEPKHLRLKKSPARVRKSPTQKALETLAEQTGNRADQIVREDLYKAATAVKPRVIARPAELGMGYQEEPTKKKAAVNPHHDTVINIRD